MRFAVQKCMKVGQHNTHVLKKKTIGMMMTIMIAMVTY